MAKKVIPKVLVPTGAVNSVSSLESIEYAKRQSPKPEEKHD
jgi:hypothetical protein